MPFRLWFPLCWDPGEVSYLVSLIRATLRKTQNQVQPRKLLANPMGHKHQRPHDRLQGESWEREGQSGDPKRIRAMLRWPGYLDIPVILPR